MNTRTHKATASTGNAIRTGRYPHTMSPCESTVPRIGNVAMSVYDVLLELANSLLKKKLSMLLPRRKHISAYSTGSLILIPNPKWILLQYISGIFLICLDHIIIYIFPSNRPRMMTMVCIQGIYHELVTHHFNCKYTSR